MNCPKDPAYGWSKYANDLRGSEPDLAVPGQTISAASLYGLIDYRAKDKDILRLLVHMRRFGTREAGWQNRRCPAPDSFPCNHFRYPALMGYMPKGT